MIRSTVLTLPFLLSPECLRCGGVVICSPVSRSRTNYLDLNSAPSSQLSVSGLSTVRRPVSTDSRMEAAGDIVVKMLADHSGRDKTLRTLYYALMFVTDKMKNREAAANWLALAK